MKRGCKILLLAFVLLGHGGIVRGQFPPGKMRMLEMGLLSSSTPPPVITPPTLSSNQTVTQFRTTAIKDLIHKASLPEYRSVDGQMYNIQPLADFLLWVVDLPVSPETTAMLKKQTRPLPGWSLIYGRVAQVTDRSGILLWEYDQPEMVNNPKLVCLRNYPMEKKLVDGDIVVAFARNRGPFSYMDTSRGRSTVNAYDFGQPVTKQQVQSFMQQKSSLAKPVPAQPNVPPTQARPSGP